MADLPSGRVTFLFTDIEGSTRLVQEFGAERYGELLALHSRLLRSVVEAHGGSEFGSEGDAHFFVFEHGGEAARAAVDIQRALAAADWPGGTGLRVRVGLHTGTPERVGENYLGVDLSRVARITAAGHGGQILASEATRAQAPNAEAPARFVDLGQHRLKDLIEPEHLFQVVAPGLLVEFPPIRTIDTRPKQLPAQVSSFIGREDELGTVARLLDEHRLVTLTGPGGSGKTRLAIAAADRSLPAFEDGVFFVPLAPLRDAELIPLTVAAAVGVREATDRPVLASLVDFLKSRQLLIVLDNVEHLLEGARIAGQLLEAAPRLKILVTSRILLRLYGEREYSVPPLPLPDPRAALARVAANPAVALFVDRASAVSPEFALSAASAPTVAEICRRLDGLPLAIELAAARMRILSPDDLARRLDRRLAALVGGATDLPDRQRTLRATIEWSHDLLGESERRMFARLSAFDGGWAADGADVVAGDGFDEDPLDMLERLVDQSLVRRVESGPGRRFEMLETIREFAAERLAASGEQEAVRARHARHVVGLVEAAEPNLTGPAAAEWAERLRLDLDNVRTALRWALAGDAPERLEIGLRIAAAGWRYWQHAGMLSEGRVWIERLLGHAGAAGPSAARARALAAAGGIAYWQGDYAAMGAWYREAAELAEQVGDVAVLAEAVENLGYARMVEGDTEGWKSAQLRAQELWRAAGDRFKAALAGANAAYTGFFTNDFEPAIAPMLEMVEEARRAGDSYWLINGLTGLGQLHRLLGNVDVARRYYAEALQLALEHGNLALLTMALEPLANVEADVGQHERAVRLWAASDAVKERMGGGAPAEEMRVVDPREAATAALDAERVARAWSDGRAMTPAEAVAEAIAIAGIDQERGA